MLRVHLLELEQVREAPLLVALLSPETFWILPGPPALPQLLPAIHRLSEGDDAPPPGYPRQPGDQIGQRGRGQDAGQRRGAGGTNTPTKMAATGSGCQGIRIAET